LWNRMNLGGWVNSGFTQIDRSAVVGAGLLAKAACQLMLLVQKSRIRQQAGSHKGKVMSATPRWL